MLSSLDSLSIAVLESDLPARGGFFRRPASLLAISFAPRDPFFGTGFQ
jgi:hypothetical protein